MPPLEPHEEEARQLAARATGVAASRSIATGTAGWTDPSLLSERSFYPPSAKTSEARLRHYATAFSFVEVDATYYALLARELFEKWASWTPPEFTFHVKAYPVLTGHPIDVARLPGDLRVALEGAGFKARVYPDDLPSEIARELEARFIDSIEPLRAQGKLAGVLVQFPPWFEATRGNVRKIEALRERYPDLPMNVEFRHGSWLSSERRERVFEMLASHRFVFVGVDEPIVATGLPFVVRATHPEIAMLRLHGRNVTGWTKKGASVAERFHYLYAPSELAEFVPALLDLSQKTKKVHVVFNNCIRDFAVVGARGLTALLEDAGDGESAS